MAGYGFNSDQIAKLEADNRKLIDLQKQPAKPKKFARPDVDLRSEAESIAMGLLDVYGELAEQYFVDAFRAAQVMALQPGSTKLKNGKTYTLNENHRWTVEEDSPGQQRLFDAPQTTNTSGQANNTFLGTNKLPARWRFAPKPKSEPRQFPLPTSAKEWNFYLTKHKITPEQIAEALEKIIPKLEIDGLESYEQLKREAEKEDEYSRYKRLKSTEVKALRKYLLESEKNYYTLDGRFKNKRGLTESASELTLFHNFLRVLGGKKPLDKKTIDKLNSDTWEQIEADYTQNKLGVTDTFIPHNLNFHDFYLLLRHKLAELDNQAVAMSLQPGARKTENGREYVLNQNSRWERADKDQGQKRATTRDQVGENGELYQPGQFISTVDKPKKKRAARIAAAKERKQEVAPYTWEKPPSAYHTSIFAHYAGTALARSGDTLIVYQSFKAKHPELDWNKIESLADRYNQGDRWFQTEQNLADQAADEAATDSENAREQYAADVVKTDNGETSFRMVFTPRDFIPYKPKPGTKNSDYIGQPGTPSAGFVPDMEFLKSRPGLNKKTKAGSRFLSEEAAQSGTVAISAQPVGERVNVRIDIPTFDKTGKYVVTMHEPGTRVAAVIGYTPAIRMKNIKLMNQELTAVKIMEGVNKTTVAAAEGEVVPFEMPSEDELNREWIPVGYNPQHAVFYYDKRTGREVRKGGESISIGNTIFIKNPEYGDRDTANNPYDVRYASIRGDETKTATTENIQKFLNQLNEEKIKRVKKRESEAEHNLRLSIQIGTTKIEDGKQYVLNENSRWERKQQGLFGETYAPKAKAKKELPKLAERTIQPVPQVPRDAKETGKGWVDYKTKKELAQWYLRNRLDTLNDLAGAGKLDKIEGGRDPRILINRRLKYGRPVDMVRKMLSPVYLSGSWSPSVSKVARQQGQQIGMLITPDTKSNIKHLSLDVDEGSPEYIAVDNGVFGGNFDSAKFLSLLDDLAEKQVQGITMFVTAPDSFDRASMTGDAAETIKNFSAWSKQIRQRGFPAAMVAQDGLEYELENMPWDDIDVLFIGGSDQFKLGKFTGEQKTKWEKIWKEARRRGVPVHVGRVNSLSRLKFAEKREFDSADGNFIKHGPDINAPKVAAWLKKLADKEAMDRSQANRVQEKLTDEYGEPIAMALQPGMTKSVNGKAYVLNQNHRWTLRKQGGLFGEDYKPGKWTPEEHEKLTGEKKGKAPQPKERQEEMFDRGKKEDLPGQSLLFEDDDGVARKPSESERSLAASNGDTAYHRKARKVVAKHYLATSATFFDFESKSMKPLTQDRVTGMMDGIDLSKPIVVGPPPSVPPPEKLAQWQAPGGNRGGYFSTTDMQPSDLGIGDLATAWGLPNKPILKRERKLYSLRLTPGAHYMRSTAKETVDNWGAQGLEQKASGGGVQWFIPNAADPTLRIEEL